MCVIKTPKYTAPTAAPVATSEQIQKQTEDARFSFSDGSETFSNSGVGGTTTVEAKKNRVTL